MAVISPAPDTSKHEDKGIVRSRTFAQGTGEVDMLVGFFVMNGACIGKQYWWIDLILLVIGSPSDCGTLLGFAVRISQILIINGTPKKFRPDVDLIWSSGTPNLPTVAILRGYLMGMYFFWTSGWGYFKFQEWVEEVSIPRDILNPKDRFFGF